MTSALTATLQCSVSRPRGIQVPPDRRGCSGQAPKTRLTVVARAAQDPPRDPRDGPNYRRGSGGDLGGPDNKPGSHKDGQFSETRRRKGRPAHQRSPDDSPFRDGNRDRLYGLLTQQSAETLLFYFSETNHHNYQWLMRFIKANPPAPLKGSWQDVSGETFLRKLLSMPVQEIELDFGSRPQQFSKIAQMAIDPRNLAQRILDIRAKLAVEFNQDLNNLKEENNSLLVESLQDSLLASFSLPSSPGSESDFSGSDRDTDSLDSERDSDQESERDSDGDSDRDVDRDSDRDSA